MARRLPSTEEALRILAARRTRPARKAPPPAGKSLAKFVKALDERFGQGPTVMQARWREIVGERLAARTEPVKLIRSRTGGPGTLELKVEGSAAALIQHQSAEILERVNLFLGGESVGKLRIVQGPVKKTRGGAGRPPPPAPRRPAPPLDAAREAELTRSVERAERDELKDALLRLGRSVLRQDETR
jgi:hypothetical protein